MDLCIEGDCWWSVGGISPNSLKSCMGNHQYHSIGGWGVGDALRLGLVFKKFQDFSSNRIFGCMYETLNIDKNKNQLYSLPVIYETNPLNPDSLWLDNNYQIQTKVL